MVQLRHNVHRAGPPFAIDARDFRAGLAQSFDQLDLIMTPAAAAQPWPAEEAVPTVIAGREAGPLGACRVHAMVDACEDRAIALPAGLDEDGRPVGIQLVAPNGCDEFLLDVAETYEAAFLWSHAWPKIAMP